MAKMLTKVWKTAQGIFLETEKEALEAERHDAIGEAIRSAWDESIKENNRRREERQKERVLRGWSDSCISGTANAAIYSSPASYAIPSGFELALTKKMEEAGILPPIQVRDDV